MSYDETSRLGIHGEPPIHESATPPPETVSEQQPSPRAGTPYSKLGSASGSDVYYRQDRYSTDQFQGVRIGLTIWEVAGTEHDCELFDLSQTGLAFVAWPDWEPASSSRLDKARICFNDFVAYDGKIEFKRSRELGSLIIVGVEFADYLINIDDVLKLRDINAASREALEKSGASYSWRISGNHEIKASIADLALYLNSVQKQLNQMERSICWEEMNLEENSPLRKELLSILDSGFCKEYVQLSADIDSLYRRIDPESSEGLKAYSRELLHPYLLKAPLVVRMYEKPLGYAGDYVVMNYLYLKRFEGQDLFARGMHRATAALHGGAAVRDRKDLLKSRLQARISDGNPLKIVSIAAGTAQEAYEILNEFPADGPEIEYILFDQDKKALSYAQSRILSIIRKRHLRNFKLRCLNDGIKNLLKGQSKLIEHAPFDFCYTAGLMDYLRQDLGQRLVNWFYSSLNNGGVCYIGNFAPQNPSRWTMEHLYEWYLVHRSAEEMLDLASKLPDVAIRELDHHGSEINPFLMIKKPT